MSNLPTITLKGSELRDLVTPVLSMTAAADLPVLATVLLETHGDQLLATATDRFRLGISRLTSTLKDEEDQPVKQSADFRALVPIGDLKRLLTLFKPKRYDDPTLTLRVIAGLTGAMWLEVEQAGAFDGLAAVSLRFALVDGDYPKIRKILADAIKYDGEPATSLPVNGAFLAAFKDVVRLGYSVTLRPTAPTKPIVVTCGEHFVGALMPRRSDEIDHTNEWTQILDGLAETPESKAEVA